MSDSGVDAGSDTDSLGNMSVGSSIGSDNDHHHHVEVHPPQVHHQQRHQQPGQQLLEGQADDDADVLNPQEDIQDDELVTQSTCNVAVKDNCGPGNDFGDRVLRSEQHPTTNSHSHQPPNLISNTWSMPNDLPDIVLSSPNPGLFRNWRSPEEPHDLQPKMKAGRRSRLRIHVSQDYTSSEVLLEKKLRNAANAGDVDLVRRLLDEGVDPSSGDNKQRTALHFAACLGNVEMARLLLERGADSNHQDVVGNTPLHLAACTNHTELVTLLLKYGTDVTVLDKSGRTPLHLAQAKLKILQSAPPRDQQQQQQAAISSSSSSSTACLSSAATTSSPTTPGVSDLKHQVLQVIEMMQVYLQRSGKQAEADLLCNFSSRIHQHQTKAQVDLDVNELLASLNHLSLQSSPSSSATTTMTSSSS